MFEYFLCPQPTLDPPPPPPPPSLTHGSCIAKPRPVTCAKVSWKSGEEWHHKEIKVPPRLVQNTGASVTNRAVETGVPQLSVASLSELAKKLRFLLLNEVPDNATANVRKKAHTSTLLRPNMFYAPAGCAGHKCHRIMTNATNEDHVIGDVYAVDFVCHIPSHQNKILREFFKMVDDGLEVVDRPPIPEFVEHTKGILRHTVLRNVEFTRGRLDADLESILPGRLRDDADNMLSKAATFINGDPRLSTLCHFENGCCPEGRQQTVQSLD